MAVVVNLDKLLVEKKMTSRALAAFVGITEQREIISDPRVAFAVFMKCYTYYINDLLWHSGWRSRNSICGVV